MIPAVPKYVQDADAFAHAPPGHRFGLYFPVWRPEDWVLESEKKARALKQTLALPHDSVDMLDHLLARQAAWVDRLPEGGRVSLFAKSTSPFATGLGMEHPLENGFAFLNPYGLAYLPGSSVKGVLRRAAEDLSGDLYEEGNQGWDQPAIDCLFGPQVDEREPDVDRRRGALVFWDVIPKPNGGRMGMEVMTPHSGDYYQGKSTPHDAGQPKPNFFMVVPPESEFVFHVTCDIHRLDAEMRVRWKDLMRSAMHSAYEWLGFGAKTAVGYGALEIDIAGEEARRKATEEIAGQEAEQVRQEAMTPLEREMEEVMAKSPDNPGAGLYNAVRQGRWDNADDRPVVARKIKELWGTAGSWNPDFDGKNKKKVQQRDRCREVRDWLEG